VDDLNDEMEILHIRMDQLTEAIDKARTSNEQRDEQQTENLEKITQQLKEQTDLTNVAEEDLAEVKQSLEK